MSYICITIINSAMKLRLDPNSTQPLHQQAEELLRKVELYENRHDLATSLPYGKQRHLEIARALATKPAILLCDEPTGNLDSRTSQDVLGLLKVTSQQYAQTIVMITHNEEIAQLADRIIRIEDGRIRTGGQEA